MASLIWTAVWFFLMFELIVTLILVIPVPRKIRNAIARQINRLDLGDRLGKVAIFIGIALTMALSESISSVHYFLRKEHNDKEHYETPEHERIFYDLIKQRKFRSERNMYLAGFSLTLLFVIVRISQLMQESVEWEEQVNALTKAVASEEQQQGSTTQGVELTSAKPMKAKKKDWTRLVALISAMTNW